MFKIFLAVLVVSTGQVSLYTSQETYDTKEACEAKLPERIAPVKKKFEEDGLEVKIGAKCDVDGIPS